MITNLNIGNMGRIGNQLFQYSFLRGISLKLNYPICLPKKNDLIFHGQHFLLKKFNLNCEFSDEIKPNNFYKEEMPNVYDERVFESLDNTSFEGYFQNLKYFDFARDYLINEFTLDSKYIKKAEQILSSQRRENEPLLISFHIRRGDHFLRRKLFTKSYGLKIYGSKSRFDKNSPFGKYFLEVKNYYIDKNVKFLVFSGGSRTNPNDIDKLWLEDTFKDLNYEILSTDDPLLDFELMKKCDANVLSYGSSFGWWAAYLNQVSKEKIIAPHNYFLHIGSSNLNSNLFNERFLLL